MPVFLRNFMISALYLWSMPEENRMFRLLSRRFILLLGCCALSACLVIDDYVKEVENSGVLSPSVEDTVGAIKLALQDGVETSVRALGKVNGFYGDKRVRIPLPKDLENIEDVLRRFGQDKYADDFAKTLNNAAEQAIPEATTVFVGAIKQMSIQDAIGIMRGSDNAATQYFRKVSSVELRGRFAPIVSQATSKVGVTKAYKDLSQRLALFGVKTKVSDLDGYVTEKALDGLFLYVADEEAKIRKDPLGQGAALVRRVFQYYQ